MAHYFARLHISRSLQSPLQNLVAVCDFKESIHRLERSSRPLQSLCTAGEQENLLGERYTGSRLNSICNNLYVGTLPLSHIAPLY